MRFWTLAVVAFALACGARTPLDYDAEGGLAVGGGSGGSGSGGGPPGTGGALGRCIYLLSSESVVYRLQPDTLDREEPAVEEIGPIDCPVFPNTMAVSDSGLAYVGTSDGWLQPVDAMTAYCVQNVGLARPGNPDNFGLGLLRPAGQSEAIYAVQTDRLLTIAPFDGSQCCTAVRWEYLPPRLVDRRPEPADSDDGELYFLYPDSAGQATVERYETDQRLTFGSGTGVNGWDAVRLDGRILAFTAYGGTTTIHTLATDPLTYLKSGPTLPFAVIGAGLSSCGAGPPFG